MDDRNKQAVATAAVILAALVSVFSLIEKWSTPVHTLAAFFIAAAVSLFILLRKRPSGIDPTGRIEYYPKQVRRVAAAGLVGITLCLGFWLSHIDLSRPFRGTPPPLAFVDESITASNRHITFRFSLVNTLPDRRITVYSLRLRPVVLVADEDSHYKKERIDLGAISVSGSSLRRPRPLAKTPTSLLAERFVIALEPKHADSFLFRLRQPARIGSSFSLIFLVDALYFDDLSHRGVARSQLLYSLVFDELTGFSLRDSLPTTAENLRTLRTKYAQTNLLTMPREFQN